MDESCIGCLASPMDVSLVLQCDHRLCMACAAVQLRWQPADTAPKTTCPRCRSDTEVNGAAAQHIREMFSSQDATASKPTESITESGRAKDSSSAGTPQGQKATLPVPKAKASHQQLCGQCQARPAELDCRQCQEQFCSTCSIMMHRVGRMQGHTIQALADVRSKGTMSSAALHPDLSPIVGPSSQQQHLDRQQSGSPTSFLRDQVLHCEAHPEEPMQFFCLDCESEPVCAECVVHQGALHHGHRVLKIKDAFKKLCHEEMLRLEQVGRDRTEDRAQAAHRADVLKRDLSLSISQGRQRIQESFARLRNTMNQKGAQMQSGIEACSRAADAVLAGRTAQIDERVGEIWDAHAMLSNFDTDGDEVKILNTYAVLQLAVSRYMEPFESVDGGGFMRLLDGMKTQVRDAIAEQLANASHLSGRVSEVRGGQHSMSFQCATKYEK